ncbi:MAG: hypothetical protein P1V21_24070 [Rhizobiaceae bacterium]|nr:hypothetical protein [Rhizobiaceae bacterium]
MNINKMQSCGKTVDNRRQFHAFFLELPICHHPADSKSVSRKVIRTRGTSAEEYTARMDPVVAFAAAASLLLVPIHSVIYALSTGGMPLNRRCGRDIVHQTFPVNLTGARQPPIRFLPDHIDNNHNMFHSTMMCFAQ